MNYELDPDQNKTAPTEAGNNDTSEQLADLRNNNIIPSLQEGVIAQEFTDFERADLQKDVVADFVEGILGKEHNAKFGHTLTVILTTIAAHFNFTDHTYNWKEIAGDLEKANLEKTFIAHRGNEELGDEQSLNQLAKAKDALAKGRTVEVDVRKGEYLLHDPIEVAGIPPEKLPKLDTLLEYLVQNPDQGPLMLDIKGGKADAEKIIAKVRALDEENAHDPKYKPLIGRIVYASFNPNTIAKIKELDPQLQTIFHYIPTQNFPWICERILPGLQSGEINSKKLIELLEKQPGESLPPQLAKILAETKIYADTKEPFKHPDVQHAACLYSTLPPAEVVAVTDYVSVHYLLVLNTPEFFKELKAAGKRIMVYGFPVHPAKSGLAKQAERHKQELIALGVDNIITDSPLPV